MSSNKLEYVLSLKDQFSKGLRGAADETAKLDSKMNAMKSGIGKIGGVIAGAFAVDKIIEFGKAVFDSLDNYQKFHASLKTMLQGNEYAAKGLEAQLVSLAKTTPFELKEVQDATKQLLAYGFKAGEVVDTMRTLGDVSAGIGAPVGDIAYLYGTLKTSGRVTLTDLRQFAGRGIPIYETLAKRLKVTTAAISAMATEGKIGFKDIEGAFKDMTKAGGQFFNLMEDQSKTVGGMRSNLEDTWEQIKVNIGKSQTGIISGTLNFMSKMATILNNKLSASNFMSEAFQKGGVAQFGTMDRLYSNLPMFGNALSGGYNKAHEEAMYVESLIEGTKDMKTAAYNLQLLSAGLRAIDRDFRSGKMSTQEMQNLVAIRKEGIKMIEGQMKNMMSTKQTNEKGLGAEDTITEKAGKQTKSLGTGVEVSANRPQALTINIDKLIEDFTVSTNNMTEGVAKVREMVTKVLLEAVNDANLAIR
ncbi:MAG: tape measure protein [Flavobacteriia bacterium]|jgi:tape measure domain-containing protein